MILTIQFVSNRAQPTAEQAAAAAKGKLKIIQKQCLPIAAMVALFAMPYFTTQADIVTYVEQRHLTVAVGMYFLIYAAFLMLIRLFLRNQFDTVRFGVWLYASVAADAFYLVMLLIMKNNWQMALAAAGMAIGYGTLYSVCQSTAMMVAPKSERGLASATFFLGLDIGMSFGPIIAGFIDTLLPIKYFYVVWLIIVPLLLIIYWFNRRTLNGAIDNH